MEGDSVVTSKCCIYILGHGWQPGSLVMLVMRCQIKDDRKVRAGLMSGLVQVESGKQFSRGWFRSKVLSKLVTKDRGGITEGSRT